MTTAEESITPASAKPLAATLSAGELPSITGDMRSAFLTDGFVVVEQVLRESLCDDLTRRLDAMLAGEFDTGQSPDKVPSAMPRRRPRVEQLVNAWRGDRLFTSVVQSDALAAWVADMLGWSHGAEVLQDQIWCKPPGSGPIGFHRDAAYMGEGMATLWLALDDLHPALGPLEYARGSHTWPPPAYDGYMPSLFGKKDYKCELNKAAALCGKAVDIVPVLVARGGGSLHTGSTWHGSGVNRHTHARRGLGIHFGPLGARPVAPTALARQLRVKATISSTRKDQDTQSVEEDLSTRSSAEEARVSPCSQISSCSPSTGLEPI